MKKTWKVLLLALAIGETGHVAAQEKTNTAVLEKMQFEFAAYEKNSLSKALALSKQKGWPVSKRDGNGNFVMLTGVDDNGMPVYTGGESNFLSAVTLGTNQLWTGGSSGLNLSGSDAAVRGKLAIWDEGKVRDTHVEFGGRVIQKDNATTLENHATHVAGTMVASGVNPAAKGMAFGLQDLQAYDFSNHITEMTTAAPGLWLSNHSYGQPAGWQFNSSQNRWEFNAPNGAKEDYKFGYYSAETQRWDSIAFNAPNYLIVKSVGNNRNQTGPAVGANYWGYDAGNTLVDKGARPSDLSSNNSYDIISTYGTSKNILTVGAVDAISGGYSSPADVKIAAFSSWGPTDDGRIKPDIVGVGTNVLSTYAGSDNAYATISGTSMSSPNITGSLLLLQELYARSSANPMRSATLKGIVLHTADESGSTPGPDYIHGWGLANIPKAASVITSRGAGSLLEERNLLSGVNYTIQVVASGKEPLVVSICWTDPKGEVTPGTPLNNRDPKLVHDLDLRILRNAETFFPWKLEGSNPSGAATRADNSVDNFEKIEIPNPIPGETYTIRVSNKGALARGQQAYSLVATGVNGTAYCGSSSSGTGPVLQQFQFLNTAENYNTSTCIAYQAPGALVINAEPSSNPAFSLKLANCAGGAIDKIAKIFIDYNNDGDFADAGELAATSAVINANNGDFTGNIAIPATAVVGSTTRLRIVVQATSSASNVAACGNYTSGATYDYNITFLKPSSDLRVSAVVFPAPGACANTEQKITVRLRNNGTAVIDSFPVNITVRNGATVVANVLSFYRGKVEPASEVLFTAPLTFNATAGATYTIEATSTLTDQIPGNNTIVTNVTIAGPPAAPTGSAVICSNSAILSSTQTAETLLWYSAATGSTPLGAGTNVNTPTIPSNKTYYAARNDFNYSPGPVSSNLGTNSYFWFSGIFNQVTTTIPVTLESFRIYSASSGKADIIVAKLSGTYTPGQSYSFTTITSVSLNVQQSRNPVTGVDTGFIYQVNLSVPTPDDYIVIMNLQAIPGGDTLRVRASANIPANPYPIGNNFFKITGNNNYTAANPTQFERFYFMMYDMKVKSVSCATERTPIVGIDAATPTITQNDNLLTSSVGGNLQWYRNNVAIPGASGATYTIVEPGIYKVAATTGLCTTSSNEINAQVTALVDLDNPGSTNALVAPNPNNGNFELALQTTRTGKLGIALFNTQGQVVYQENGSNFTGTYLKNFRLQHLANGLYWLKITHAGKEWTQKIIIAK